MTGPRPTQWLRSGALDRAVAQAKAVCLDIYDTAVLRALLHPAGVFSMVQRVFERDRGPLGFPFRQARMAAEAQARRSAWELHGAVEVRLEDIYACLKGSLDNAGDAHTLKGSLARLLALEIAVETRCAMPNGPMLAFYRRCLDQGKPVAFISDMYLPRQTVEAVLAACGYAGPHRLFVSSEHMATKASGGLFHIARQSLGCAFSEMLHIGDNQDSDIRAARELGMRAHLVAKPACRMRTPGAGFRLPKLAGRWAHLPATHSVLAALEANHRHIGGQKAPCPEADAPALRPTSGCPGGSASALAQHAPDTQDVWQTMGYRCFGPLLAGFTHWLLAGLERQGADTVFFLSRDGYFLKRLFDRLQALRGGRALRTVYLLASRRALNIASLTVVDERALDFLQSGSSTLPVEAFLRRAGLDPAAHLEAVRGAGFAGPQQPVRTATEYAQLRKLFTALAEPLLAVAARERGPLRAYLEGQGFFAAARPAMVDIGWHGTLQESLERLRVQTHSQGQNTPDLAAPALHGYYLGTFAGASHRAARLPMAGYACHLGLPDTRKSILTQCVEIVETALLAPHGSLVRFENNPDGPPRPVFEATAAQEALFATVARLQQGALDFFDDLAPLALEWGLPLPARQVLEPLKRLLTRPCAVEAACLGDVMHAEGFGDVNRYRPIARPPGTLGGLANPAGLLRAAREAHWQAGFARRSPLWRLWRACGLPT